MGKNLFRGKRVDNCEWIYGSLIKRDIGCFIVDENNNQALRYCSKFVSAFDSVVVYSKTVGQFTGLTDKNGKKIFEGDECRLTRHCILCYGSITFKKGSFWFEEFNTDSVIELNRLKPNNFEIEVIGNIHDNPELLGGADNG